MSSAKNRQRSKADRPLSRRRFLLCAGAAIGSVSLASRASGGTPQSASSPTKAAAPSARQFSGVTLRISTQNNPSTEAWKAIIPGFESRHGAKVEIMEDSYTQIQPKQFAEAAAHTGTFDLIGLQYFDLGKYVVGSVLTDLTPFFNDRNLMDPAYDLADFVPIVVDAYGRYEVSGKRGLYALPHKFDIYLGIYRPDLFEAAGVKQPDDSFSYDDLLAAAENLRPKQGNNPVITIPLKAPGPAFTTWSAIYRSYGGEYFDANKYPLFTGEAAITAVEKLRSMLKYMPVDAAGLDFDAALRIMSQGRAAYAENWNGFFPTILDPKQSQVAEKIKFLPTPAGPKRRAQELGGWSVGMSPDSKNKEAAFTLLLYLTSKETAPAYALAGGSSARVSVATDARVVEKYPYYPLMIKALKDAVPRPTDPTWGETQGAIGTAVNASLQPNAEPKKEFVKAARSVYQLMQRVGHHPEKTGPAPN